MQEGPITQTRWVMSDVGPTEKALGARPWSRMEGVVLPAQTTAYRGEPLDENPAGGLHHTARAAFGVAYVELAQLVTQEST